MKTTQTVFALTLALVLGTIATSLLSGCKKPSTPATSGSSGTNTTEIEDIDISIPEIGDGEPMANEAPTEEPAAPMPEEPAAPAPASTNAPKEEPAPEPKKEKPKAEPAPAKPADEPAPAPAEEPKPAAAEVSAKPAAGPVDKSANAPIKPGDWAQWAGTSYRNNTPIGKGIPTEWEVGDFDRKTGDWVSDDAQNIKWVARIGSQSYGNPVIADGRVYVAPTTVQVG